MMKNSYSRSKYLETIADRFKLVKNHRNAKRNYTKKETK